MAKAMGSHQSSKMLSDVWLTPPDLLKALGPFDLDPCAAPEPRPWPTAAQHFVKADNGLARPWHGRVWCNPPYSVQARRWLQRMVAHGNGIALTFARTETAWFWETIWEPKAASGVLFLKGRLHFHRPDGSRAEANAGAPSVLVAYGQSNVEALRQSGLEGALVDFNR